MIMKALTGIATGINKAELKKALAVVIAVALLIVSAKIQVPFWPVPLTMQSAVVLMLPCVMGLRAGMLSIALYLGIGLAGYPVFASAAIPAGPFYFLGATGGYLLGFIVAGALVGRVYERTSYKAWLPGLTALMLLGHVIILTIGGLWLAYGIPAAGFDGALAMGVMPFLTGSVAKSVLAALCVAGFASRRR